jgi:hypothetical protein
MKSAVKKYFQTSKILDFCGLKILKRFLKPRKIKLKNK